MTYHLPDGAEVGQEVSILHKLCDKTDWLLESHTANHVHNVRVVSFSNLLHCFDFCEKVTPFTTSGSFCREVGREEGRWEGWREGGGMGGCEKEGEGLRDAIQRISVQLYTHLLLKEVQKIPSS